MWLFRHQRISGSSFCSQDMADQDFCDGVAGGIGYSRELMEIQGHCIACNKLGQITNSERYKAVVVNLKRILELKIIVNFKIVLN